MPPRATMAASTLCAPLLRGPRTVLEPVARTSVSLLLATPGAELGVSLQTPAAVLLPQSLVVRMLPPGDSTLSIGLGGLWYDGQPVTVRRWFEPSRVARGMLPDAWAASDDIDRLLAEWPALLGRGDGLTPFGDDVLCGALLGLRAMAHPAEARLRRELAPVLLDEVTTPMSAALLRAAMRGWCIPQVAALVRSLAAGAPCRAEVGALLAVGHSSGRGLLTGLARVLAPVESDVAA